MNFASAKSVLYIPKPLWNKEKFRYDAHSSYPAISHSIHFLVIFILNRKIKKEVISLHWFNFYLPVELYDRIKLMAKFYQTSTTKMMVRLLEMGYLKMLESNQKEIWVYVIHISFNFIVFFTSNFVTILIMLNFFYMP